MMRFVIFFVSLIIFFPLFSMQRETKREREQNGQEVLRALGSYLDDAQFILPLNEWEGLLHISSRIQKEGLSFKGKQVLLDEIADQHATAIRQIVALEREAMVNVPYEPSPKRRRLE